MKKSNKHTEDCAQKARAICGADGSHKKLGLGLTISRILSDLLFPKRSGETIIHLRGSLLNPLCDQPGSFMLAALNRFPI